jgi:DNA-binding transcriptional LysR family regulator
MREQRAVALPDWDDFRLLLTIVQSGSFSRAAVELGLTQPTVSRRVARLEQNVGAQLVNRTNNGIALTAEGQRVVDELHVAHGAILRAIGRARSPTIRQQELRLLTTEGLAAYWLSHFLPFLFEYHPEISLRVYTSNDGAGEMRKQCDLAIHFLPPNNPQFVGLWLGTLHLTPGASPAYLARHGRPRTVAELANHRLLDTLLYLIDKGAWTARLPESEQLHASYYTNSSAALGEAIRKGTGIGLIPSYALLFEQGFVPLDVGMQFPSPFWLSYQEKILESPSARVLIAFIRHIFNAGTMPWFSETYVPPASFPSTTPAKIMAGYSPDAGSSIQVI